jgi:hypothetical protein
LSLLRERINVDGQGPRAETTKKKKVKKGPGLAWPLLSSVCLGTKKWESSKKTLKTTPMRRKTQEKFAANMDGLFL